ncbi:Poly [ADP-ribose] polymerase, partial [Quillaja saponaria]
SLGHKQNQIWKLCSSAYPYKNPKLLCFAIFSFLLASSFLFLFAYNIVFLLILKMEQILIEDEYSVISDETVFDGAEESDATSLHFKSNEYGCFAEIGLNLIKEETLEHQIITKSFFTGMSFLEKDAEIVAIHKNQNSCSLLRQARLESFQIFTKALMKKCGGDANLRFGWYGGSKNDLIHIICHGFNSCSSNLTWNSSHGIGVCLSPAKFSIDSALSTMEDEDGLRHVLLCRVILGKVEVVNVESKQNYPSSKDYDSGVDSIAAPRRYIVWNAFMNSHISPDYVISFKCSPPKNSPVVPNSPWMGFPSLISILSKMLEPSKIRLLNKCYNDFKKHKIMRREMVNKVKDIAGERLLVAVLKSYRKPEIM